MIKTLQQVSIHGTIIQAVLLNWKRHLGGWLLLLLLGGGMGCKGDPPVIQIQLRDDLQQLILQSSIENGLSSPIRFDVPQGIQTLLFEVKGEIGKYYTTKLINPLGRDVVEGGEYVSREAREIPGVVQWMFPLRPGIALPDGTWELMLRAENWKGAHLDEEDFQVSVYMKAENPLNSCGIHIDFLVDRDAIHVEDFQLAADGLAARLNEIYAQIKVKVVDYATQQLTLLSADIDLSSVSAIKEVSDMLATAVHQGGARKESLHILMVRSIGGISDPGGYSIGLPGPYNRSSSAAAMLLATSKYLGSDGYLDVHKLGTTLSHEIGHYMGLYHPSEPNYSGMLSYQAPHDPIPDTPQCEGNCSDDFLKNIMTPGMGDLRTTLTAQQGEVFRSHPLCVPMQVEIPVQKCTLQCETPSTCALNSGIQLCLVACDPEEPACPNNEPCLQDDVGTFVCTAIP